LWEECRKSSPAKNKLEELLAKGANPNTLNEEFYNALGYVVRSNKYEIVELLLENNADPDIWIGYRGKNRYTPLMIAAHNGLIESAKLLIDYYADTTLKNGLNKSARDIAREKNQTYFLSFLSDYSFHSIWFLYTAVKEGDQEEVERLLENENRINYQDTLGNTLLHYAVEKEDLDILGAILEKNPDLHLTNRQEETPLERAIVLNLPEFVYSLVARGATTSNIMPKKSIAGLLQKDRYKLVHDILLKTKNAETNLAFYQAVRDENVEQAEWQIKKGAEINFVFPSSQTALQLALSNADTAMVNLLLNQGADPNAHLLDAENAPLALAIKANDLYTYKRLLEKGADKEKTKTLAGDFLDMAIEHESHHIQKYLEKGESYYLYYQLHIRFWDAIRHGDIFLIQKYINEGAKLDEFNKDGYNALHLAVISHQHHVIDYLMKIGVDIDVQSLKKKKTALLLAGVERDTISIKKLLHYGADYRITDYLGFDFSFLSVFSEDISRVFVAFLEQKVKDLSEEVLYMNCRDNDLESVRNVLANGIDINKPDTSGWTALHYAADYGNHEIVKYLLYQGAEPDPRLEETGETPLMLAAKNGHFRSCEILLHYADSGLENHKGENVRQLALANSKELILLLLSDFEKTVSEYNFVQSVKNNNLNTARKYLADGVNPSLIIPDDYNWSPIHYACRNNNMDMIKLLIQYHADLNVFCETADGDYNPLMILVQNDDFLAGRLLLQNGAKPDLKSKEGKSAISLANKLEARNFILLFRNEEKAYEEYINDKALVYALYDGDYGLAREILESDVDINQKDEEGWTALHAAANNNLVEFAEELIQKGGDINCRNEEAYTPLMLAASRNNGSMISLLLSKGADTTLTNKEGKTALDIAIEKDLKTSIAYLTGNEKVVEVSNFHQLIQESTLDEVMAYSAKKPYLLEAVNSYGFSALHFAVGYGKQDVCSWLLARGVDVDTRSDTGWTPLIIAAMNNKVHLAYLLLKNKADPDLEDKTGQSAREYAVLKGFRIMQQLFDHPDYVYHHFDFLVKVNDYKAEDKNEQEQRLAVLTSLNKVSDLNFTNDYDWNALFIAVRNNNLELCKLLISKGINTEMQARISFEEEEVLGSPLLIAAYNNYLELFDLLKKHISQKQFEAELKLIKKLARTSNAYWIEKYLENDETSLTQYHFGTKVKNAIDKSNAVLLQELIVEGARLTYPVYLNQIPLIYALYQSKNDLLDILIRNTSNLDTFCHFTDGDFSPIMLAARKNNLDAVVKLYNAGANYTLKNRDKKNAIGYAEQYDASDIIRFFTNPKQYAKDYLLYEAILKKDLTQLKQLISKGADPESKIKDKHLLFYALDFLEGEALNYFLSLDVDLMVFDPSGRSVIQFFAARSRYDHSSTFGVSRYEDFMPLADKFNRLKVADSILLDFINYCREINVMWYVEYLENPDESKQVLNEMTRLLQYFEQSESQAIIRLFNEKPVLLDYTSYNNMSWLQFALNRKNTEVSKYLIQLKKDFYPDDFYDSPFSIMLEQKNYELMKLLIDKGYDVNFRRSYSSYYSRSPLSYAVSRGDMQAVELLLSAGANPNLQSSYSNTSPLHTAVDMEDISMIELLLKHGASPDIGNKFTEYPLIVAVEEGFDSILYLLLETPLNINVQSKDGWTALHYAARDNNTDYLQLLLEKGANTQMLAETSDNEYTPLMLAVYNENIEAIKILVKYGADPNFYNSKGESSLSLARSDGLQSILKIFLEPEKAIADFELLEAVMKGDTDLLKESIERDANVQQLNKDLQTLLHLAANKNHADVLKLLVLHSDKLIDAQDHDGNTALHLAVDKSHKAAMDVLLAAKAEINLLNNQGESPLFIAIENYKPEIIALLVQKGADIRMENQEGRSAMELAREKGYLFIARLLENPELINQVELAHDIHQSLDETTSFVDIKAMQKLYIQINKEFEPETEKYIFYATEYCITMAYSGNGIYAYNLSEEIVDLSETVFGKKSRDYLYALEINRVLCQFIGYGKKELELAKEILRITADMYYQYSKKYAQQLIQLADAYTKNGMDSLAARNYRKALKRLDPRKDKSAYLTGLKAFAYFNYQQNDTLSYVSQMNTLLDLYQTSEINSTEAKEYLSIMTHFGNYYIKKEEIEKGLNFYEKALDYVKKSPHVEDLDARQLYTDYALQLGKLNRFEEAKSYFYKVKNILQVHQLNSGFIYNNYLTSWLKLEMQMGESDTAYQIIKELNQLFISKLDLQFALLSEAEKFSFLRTQRPVIDLIYTFCFNHLDRYPELAAMIYNNSLKMKGIMLESRKTIFSGISESNNTEAYDYYQEWKALNKDLSRLYTQSVDDRNIDPIILENKIEDIEKKLTAIAEQSYQSSMKEISYERVQDKLEADQAAVEIIHFNYSGKDSSYATYYCALVNSKDYKYPKMLYLFKEKELNRLIRKDKSESNQNYVSNLYFTRGATYTSNQTLGVNEEYIYNKLWGPVEQYLEGVDEIFLSLSGITHKIAYSALSVDSNTRLIDNYKLRFVSSSRDILSKKQIQILDAKARFYGGIQYNIDSLSHTTLTDNSFASRALESDSTRGTAWSFLEGTLEEVNNIAAMIANKGWNAEVLTGLMSTEEDIKNMNQSPDILHFATHGYFFPAAREEQIPTSSDSETLFSEKEKKSLQEIMHTAENPLVRSGLLLAGANYAWISGEAPAGKEDGILTAYEVSLLDLSNTKLVVLSACETGLGDVKGSEGVFGLQRAFKLAGAQNIIMSLWQVPDKQTVELMELFYSHLIEGDSNHTAFRKAQIAMKEKYDPYFWAAFVLVE
jgi:ankyrin repeat protein/CHAT domain-containing protein